MGRFDNQILMVRNQLFFRTGVGAPQNEHHRFITFIEHLDHMVRQDLPAHSVMGIGGALPDRQGRVQKQDALLRPRIEAAVIRRPAAEIRRHFLVDVLERRRNLDAGTDREGKAVGLAPAVIGILSEDHDLHVFEGSRVKGVEQIIHSRTDVVMHIFLLQLFVQLLIIGLFELRRQQLLPVVVEMCGHAVTLRSSGSNR